MGDASTLSFVKTHEFMCRDPKLVEKIGAATALEVRATGIQYAFAPCVAVCLTQPSPMQNLVV
jgi:beta-glucosidase-like glycosyl hydrolase